MSCSPCCLHGQGVWGIGAIPVRRSLLCIYIIYILYIYFLMFILFYTFVFSLDYFFIFKLHVFYFYLNLYVFSFFWTHNPWKDIFYNL